MSDEPRLSDQEFDRIRDWLFPGRRQRLLKAAAKQPSHMDAAGRVGIPCAIKASAVSITLPVGIHSA